MRVRGLARIPRQQSQEVAMIFCPGARVSQLQQDKLRRHDRPQGLGLCQGRPARRIAGVQQCLVEKRVGEDGTYEDLETP